MFSDLPSELQSEILTTSSNVRRISNQYYSNRDVVGSYVNKHCNMLISRNEAQNYMNKYKPNMVVFFMTKDIYSYNQFNIHFYSLDRIKVVELLYNKVDQDVFNIQIEHYPTIYSNQLPLYNNLTFDTTTTTNIFLLRTDCNQLIPNYAKQYSDFIYDSLTVKEEITDIDSFFKQLCRILYMRVNNNLVLPQNFEFINILFDGDGVPLNQNYLDLINLYDL
jgi:hypothetical protein